MTEEEEDDLDALDALDDLVENEEEQNEEDAPDESEEEGPATVKINHLGREIEVTQENLIALAQKGFDYESKMRELKEDSADYQGYLAMKQIMDENPDVRKRVQEAFTGPSGSGESQEEQDDEWGFLDDEEEEGTASKKKADSELQKEIQALNERIDVLTRERDEERQTEHQKMMEEQLRAEVEKYPALKEAGEVAYAPILGLMTLRPDADVSKVVEVVNQQFKDYENRIRSSYTDKKRQQVSQTKPMPNKTAKTVLTPPRFSHRDLDGGNVRRAALAFLEQSAPEAAD